MNTPRNLIFIGDVRGRADKLESLLTALNFDAADPHSRAGDSQLVFVGDLIDNRDTSNVDHLRILSLVKDLCERGLAYCLMGNHEFNAVGFWATHPESNAPLREHNEKNRQQHQVFLDEVGEQSKQHQSWIEWFKARPLFLDFGPLRAIHACWDERAIERLRPYLDDTNALKEEHWVNAFDRQHELFTLCEVVLKGPEVPLPEGHHFLDKHGVPRHHIRVRWWKENATTYRELGQVHDAAVDSLPDLPLSDSNQPLAQTVPVVVGHYTLGGQPAQLGRQVICVDYNAAHPDHPLVAWEWSLDRPSRFVVAPPV